MPSDARAVQARSLHRESLERESAASELRAQRDKLVRQLRADDPVLWTYPQLARAIGCSPELIAHIVKGEKRR